MKNEMFTEIFIILALSVAITNMFKLFLNRLIIAIEITNAYINKTNGFFSFAENFMNTKPCLTL